MNRFTAFISHVHIRSSVFLTNDQYNVGDYICYKHTKPGFQTVARAGKSILLENMSISYDMNVFSQVFGPTD